MKVGEYVKWEHYFPENPVPVWLLYIQDQDLWQWRLPHSKAVREAFARLWRTFDLYDRLMPMSQEQFLDFMLPIGQPLLEAKERKVSAIASRHYWAYCVKYLVPVVELRKGEERYRSDVCEVLYNQFPEAPFSVTYTQKSQSFAFWQERELQWDFRSSQRGKFDVSKVAESFGCGGHFHASGATTGLTYSPNFYIGEQNKQLGENCTKKIGEISPTQ